MKLQLEKLLQCPRCILDKIEIIISDNCSTDNTEEIVRSYIDKGLPCLYNKNPENLGMDGNFVTCFKLAKGRYVWLLGDDDCILVDSLVKVIELLSDEREYGLAHIYCKENRFSESNFILYYDKQLYAKTISYYTTFISANIVNTKYVSHIDFQKYMGTWFTLLPLYITAFLEEHTNLLINFPVFEAPKDTQRNGGYNYFEVFIANYLNIWKEYLDSNRITKQTYEYIKKDSFNALILDHIYSLLIKKSKLNYKTENAWRLIIQYYGKNVYLYTGLCKFFMKLVMLKVKSII